ncbi:hypothetical protein, partial [Pantoea sp. Pa-EAmG]|uniref:hypothetical protein n=1 Tax=Pantoea sp. Pa-EAmG TaxID=3043311 RepID=UPI0024AF5D01
PSSALRGALCVLSFVASTNFLPFFALTRLFVWLVTRLMIYSAIFDRIRVRCKKKGPQWAPYTHKENAYLYAD